MPKQALALSKILPQTLRALETLGSHLDVARVRRKGALATRANVARKNRASVQPLPVEL